MSAQTSEAEFDALFGARTHHRPIVIGERDASSGSRMGGAPPSTIATLACPRCGGPLVYLLTLARDLLGNLLEQGRALSVCVCRDATCRHQSHVITTPSSFVAVVHEDAPRSATPTALDSATEGRALGLGPLTADAWDDGACTSFASKLGGAPAWIHGWGAKEAGDRPFLFQWSEEIFPDDMEVGPSALLFGAAFVFGTVGDRGPVARETCGFWQNT